MLGIHVVDPIKQIHHDLQHGSAKTCLLTNFSTKEPYTLRFEIQASKAALML
jgi:hypothetical protein